MIADIKPQSGFGKTSTKVNVAIEGYTLGGKDCKVVANFLDADGNFVARNDFMLSGEAFDAWGVDDNYILEQAAERCGFEVIPNA